MSKHHTQQPKPATCSTCGAAIPGQVADAPGVRPAGQAMIRGELRTLYRGPREYFCRDCVGAISKAPPTGFMRK